MVRESRDISASMRWQMVAILHLVFTSERVKQAVQGGRPFYALALRILKSRAVTEKESENWNNVFLNKTFIPHAKDLELSWRKFTPDTHHPELLELAEMELEDQLKAEEGKKVRNDTLPPEHKKVARNLRAVTDQMLIQAIPVIHTVFTSPEVTNFGVRSQYPIPLKILRNPDISEQMASDWERLSLPKFIKMLKEKEYVWRDFRYSASSPSVKALVDRTRKVLPLYIERVRKRHQERGVGEPKGNGASPELSPQVSESISTAIGGVETLLSRRAVLVRELSEIDTQLKQVRKKLEKI